MLVRKARTDNRDQSHNGAAAVALALLGETVSASGKGGCVLETHASQIRGSSSTSLGRMSSKPIGSWLALLDIPQTCYHLTAVFGVDSRRIEVAEDE